ncbi:MAG: TonB family protein [bacterium]|nr:TonB family protein [bacterium]
MAQLAQVSTVAVLLAFVGAIAAQPGAVGKRAHDAPLDGAGSAAEQSPPQPLPDNAAAAYPDQALDQSVDGTVEFVALVDAEGRVERVDVVDVPREGMGFEEAVRAAVSKWSFIPSVRDGTPVAATYRGAIDFVTTYPSEWGRMYPLSTDELWKEFRTVLRKSGFVVRRKDRKNGVAITHLRRIGHETIPGLRRPDDGRRILGSQLHAFIPPWAEPGRLYLGSMNETEDAELGRSSRGYTYNMGVLEGWLLDRLDEHLGTRGRPIPKNAEPRLRLANELRPASVSQGCLDAGELLPYWSIDANPEVVESTRISPLYPPFLVGQGKTDYVAVRALVQEDGWAGDLEVVHSTAPDSEFEVSALHTVSFWRFRPARSDGCPVSSHVPVIIEFKKGGRGP